MNFNIKSRIFFGSAGTATNRPAGSSDVTPKIPNQVDGTTQPSTPKLPSEGIADSFHKTSDIPVSAQTDIQSASTPAESPQLPGKMSGPKIPETIPEQSKKTDNQAPNSSDKPGSSRKMSRKQKKELHEIAQENELPPLTPKIRDDIQVSKLPEPVKQEILAIPLVISKEEYNERMKKIIEKHEGSL